MCRPKAVDSVNVSGFHLKGNIYLSTLLHTQKPIDGRLALEIALNILQMPKLKRPGITGEMAESPVQSAWKMGRYSGPQEPISTTQVVVGVSL